jgi:hypothetical protein
MCRKYHTVLPNGVLSRSEFPKMQEDAAMRHFLMYFVPPFDISKPVLEPLDPLTKAQVYFWS